MSEQASPKPTTQEDKVVRHFAVARSYLSRQEEIWDLEKKLEVLRTRQKSSLAKYPWLGNLVGIVRKSVVPEKEKEDKKKRKSPDESMEIDSSAGPSSTPRERLAKRLAQNREKVVAAEKQAHTELLKETSHNKF